VNYHAATMVMPSDIAPLRNRLKHPSWLGLAEYTTGNHYVVWWYIWTYGNDISP
jgi:hypothetical protein